VRFVRDLSRRKFDLVIDLQGLFRSGWFTAMTGAPVRVGFANARELAHFFYTHHVPVHSMEQHAIDRYLAITDALGCGREPVEFDLPIDDAQRARVDEMLGAVEGFALILPGTNWLTKRWPAERFAALVAPLREQFGLATVIAGGPDVTEIAEVILRSQSDLQVRPHSNAVAHPGVNVRLGSDGGVLNLVGQTSLRELVALIDRAAVVIANDSGPMHIAAAMDKPLVTIFGPTNPTRTGPYRREPSVVRVDIPCSPCYSRKCSHTSCMNWIQVDAVLAQIRHELAQSCGSKL
jgi:lipopolysaccharide heptosyltransferase II